jgi:alpha-galactosidase/6-phospho-beta-glucosidase family protein
MKVTVIGGGSSYTPELINGLLERVGSFPLTELWLMDIAQERLAHPLGPAADRVQAVLDDMLETHRAYLPQF